MNKVRRWIPALLVLGLGGLATAQAEEGWNPFREKDEAARRAKPVPRTEIAPPPLAPMDGVLSSRASSQPMSVDPAGGFGTAYPGREQPPAYAQPLPGAVADPAREASNNAKIERFELEPALAADGSGLPQDGWRGMDVKAVEEALAGLSLPPRSSALNGLWQRLISAPIDPPAGGTTPAYFEALRLEALYRSGFMAALGTRLEGAPPTDVIMTAFAIRRDLVLGRRGEACQAAKALTGARSLPVGLVGELHLLSGYCAAVAGDAGGAGLAADMARDEGLDAPVALAALDALAGAAKGGLSPPKNVLVLDYRLLELLGPVDIAQILDKAEPPLLAAVALQEAGEPRARIPAAEAAARLSAISAAQLRAIYDAAPEGPDDPSLRRAELVRACAAERQNVRKLQLMRAVLSDARKVALLRPMAEVLAPMLAGVRPSPELRGDAETAVEILLMAGEVGRARDFATAASVWHWLPLLDIAEATPSESQREQNLGSLDDLIRRGRMPADLLHRLATVLDATDVNVPIPLWEAASRTPQPAGGYLPETGVLAQMQDAAKQKQVARTVLLSMRALGPAMADGAHIITLGDTIRALRRVGLDADARRLGVEALIAQWPRGTAS